MTRRNHPEESLHIAVAQFLDLALPDDAVWTTIPAGGGGKVRGAHLKAMGYKPGWPDILVVYRGRTICIELKAPGGTLSKPQKALHPRLTLAGALVYTAKRIEEVEGFLRVLMPLRASTQRLDFLDSETMGGTRAA
jgi:hypothetical protein